MFVNLILMQEKESRLIQLFNEIKNGSKTAFDELFNAYYERLVGFALQYTKQRQSAEEITSELFVRLWLKRDTIASVLNPQVYLYVSVKNACLNLIRADKKRTALFLEEERHSKLSGISINTPSIEDRELLRLLDSAVASLPAQRQLIFKLVKEDGLDNAAVAQILGLSKRTVENQLYRSLKVLADAISDYLGYHPQFKLANKKVLSKLKVLFF